MSNESMTWQEVCRELLRLSDEGYEEPWREFEFVYPGPSGEGWRVCPNVQSAFGPMPVRLKPRTIKIGDREFTRDELVRRIGSEIDFNAGSLAEQIAGEVIDALIAVSGGES